MTTFMERPRPRLVTVTPNPAIDITHHLERLKHGETNRVATVERRAGGKGVNVARIAAQLGIEVEVRGFVGGSNGATFRELLRAEHLHQSWQRIDGETRCTVAVVDSGGATLLNERGPVVTGDDWMRLTEGTASRLEEGSVIVLSGSYPPGTTENDVVTFIDAVQAAGAQVIVDTSEPFLSLAARAGADLLKPNREELYDATGSSNPIQGASVLLSLGARAVVVSVGKEGLFLVTRVPTGFRAWKAKPPEVSTGNPTGAGDAAVAALALGVLESGDTTSTGLTDHIVRAAALSASAVTDTTAGHVDLETYDRFLRHTTLEEIHDAR